MYIVFLGSVCFIALLDGLIYIAMGCGVGCSVVEEGFCYAVMVERVGYIAWGRGWLQCFWKIGLAMLFWEEVGRLCPFNSK